MNNIRQLISKKTVSIVIIIFVAIFLRLYELSSVPPSPSLDEVSIGYNAYSILKIGSDEFGTTFPILLRAYDDWRPALYVYLVIPVIKIFGLTVWTVRFPSVLLSVVTVIATYILAKELFRDTKMKLEIGNWKLEIPEATMLLLAVSPWHIYLSRLGHEVNAYLAFCVLGLLFFFKAIHFNTAQYFSKSILLLFITSAVFFVGSFYTYQSSKVFVPLIIIILVVLFKENLRKRLKEVFVAAVIGLVFLLPIVKVTLEPNALIRFQATNIFTSQHERFEKEALRLKEATENNNLLGQIIHSRRIVATEIFLEGYVSHFNPQWLFLNLSSDRHKVPHIGLFYPWEMVSILLGLYVFLWNVFDKKMKVLVVSWILFSPLSAALTTDAPHAMRSFTMLPMYSFLSATGIIYFDLLLKRFRKYFFVLLVMIILISIYGFYKNYFFVFPNTQSQSFQFALSQAIPFVLENEKRYDKIVFSNKDNLYQSYMFFLFNSRYDPALYQSQGGTKSGGFAQTHSFGKYEFRPIDWEKETKERNTLYVANPTEFPAESEKVFIGKYLDNKIGVEIVNKF